MDTQTLVLNHQYRPYTVISWKEAITDMFRGIVEVLVQYEEDLAVIDQQTLKEFPELKKALKLLIGVRAESFTIRVPSVVVLQRKVNRRRQGVRFSRQNIALRDNFTCCYCNTKLPMSQLNYDHIIPKSRGGRTDWTNIVSACYDCNSKKGNRTPEEAGMPLIVLPSKPKDLPVIEPLVDLRSVPKEWLPFLSDYRCT